MNSRTIAQFTEKVGIQSSERVMRILQGDMPQQTDLLKLQSYLQIGQD
ncbi:MAG: hypothetical protein KME10_10085 [Plectolyngbya sp. WJT66-NPBG17]|nr:hypothetical protein [Plectolyngbya sp. WJT66-NPBG17]